MLEIYDEKPYYREFMYMPCGGLAQFDYAAGYGYRCQDCMAVIGSIGQPRICQELQEKYRMWATLGGKDWEYFSDENK